MSDSLAALRIEITVSSSTLTSCKISVPKGMKFSEAVRKVRYAQLALDRELRDRKLCPAFREFSEQDSEALQVVWDAADLIRRRTTS